ISAVAVAANVRGIRSLRNLTPTSLASLWPLYDGSISFQRSGRVSSRTVSALTLELVKLAAKPLESLGGITVHRVYRNFLELEQLKIFRQRLNPLTCVMSHSHTFA